ncbi:MAG TPA: thioesterase family protein [Chitinophagaceae bacterium]|nr:thioesterase family protein [Chitinophagaceae bacterium]
MSRTKLELPADFTFSTNIPVRISDINYGGHVGNDSILALIHEARVRFLDQFGFKELQVGNGGLIMRDVVIEFKRELFYGDTVKASVKAGDFSTSSFNLFYKLEKESANRPVLITAARTGMVCYDYQRKKITLLTDEVKSKLSG